MPNTLARAAIFKAADTLLAEGVEPTVITLQERIGGGSYITIKRHLSVWRINQTVTQTPDAAQGQSRAIQPGAEALATTPVELTEALRQIKQLLTTQEAYRETLAMYVQTLRQQKLDMEILTADLHQCRRDITRMRDEVAYQRAKREHAQIALTQAQSRAAAVQAVLNEVKKDKDQYAMKIDPPTLRALMQRLLRKIRTYRTRRGSC